MLFVANWLVFVVFWYYIYRITTRYGYKIPLIAALIWYAAFAARMFLGFGALLFIPVQAMLTIYLISFDLYKINQSKKSDISEQDASE